MSDNIDEYYHSWSKELYESEGFFNPKPPLLGNLLSYNRNYTRTGISFYVKMINLKEHKSCKQVQNGGIYKKWVCTCNNDQCWMMSASYHAMNGTW